MNNEVNHNKFRNELLAKISMGNEIVRAEGSVLHDKNGKEIIDCLAQFGAVPFGHNPAFINDIVVDYFARKNPVFVQPFIVSSTKDLSNNLCEIAGKEYNFVVFSNSGTETVEAAIKLSKLKTGRIKVLSTINSFHGKTYSALSATGSKKYSNEVIVDNENYQKIRFNDIDALELALSKECFSAFIVEPVQGEGGMVPAGRDYLRLASDLCKKYGTLFIVDEIQTGMGRTGTILAVHDYDVRPDIILLSKSLGGGVYPIGAAIVKRRAYCQEFDKKHSSTFANGGLASSIANGVVNKLRNDPSVLNGVNSKSEYLQKRFSKIESKYKGLFSYSGKGLMYALRFNCKHDGGNIITSYILNSDVLSYLICGYLLNEKGLLCMPFLGDECGSIRFEPSLDIKLVYVDRFLDAIESLCKIFVNNRFDILLSYVIGRKANDSCIDEYIDLCKIRNGKDINAEEMNAVCSDSTKADSKQRKKFAFFIHSTSAEDMIRSLPIAIRTQYKYEEKLAISKWMIEVSAVDPTPLKTNEITMRGETGELVDGILISCPMEPKDLMKLSREDKTKLINAYLDVAREEGADVVGLGAYTSVITRSGEDIKSTEFNFTTGNSLTALSTAESIKDHAGKNINRKNLTIIGARGSVGRLGLLELSQFFNGINIVGSPKSGVSLLKLAIVETMAELIRANITGISGSALAVFRGLLFSMEFDETVALSKLENGGVEFLDLIEQQAIKMNVKFPFDVTIDVKDVAENTDYVMSATSEGKPFIDSDIFKEGTVIFDVARPFDFVDDGASKVEVLEGGLVYQPQDILFGDTNMIGSRAGVNLACLSETIALAMEGVSKNYSIGKKIPYAEAKEVFELAVKHGFSHFSEPNINGEVNVESVVYGRVG